MKRLTLSLITILALGITVWFGFRVAFNSSTRVTQSDVDGLVDKFPSFLEAQLQKEKPGVRFDQAHVESAKINKNGHVELKFSLQYEDLKRGPASDESRVALESTAELSRDGEVWKVLKVIGSTEQIDFQNGSHVVASDEDK